jgi:hypothetical protein
MLNTANSYLGIGLHGRRFSVDEPHLTSKYASFVTKDDLGIEHRRTSRSRKTNFARSVEDGISHMRCGPILMMCIRFADTDWARIPPCWSAEDWCNRAFVGFWMRGHGVYSWSRASSDPWWGRVETATNLGRRYK